MQKQTHVIICVTNDLSTDQRVHKVAVSLQKHLNYTVTLTGRHLQQSKKIDRPYQTKRFRLLINSGSLFYLCYNLRLFIYLLFSKFTIVVSNDLDTLPACRVAAALRRKKLVFDSHELFTEVPELVHRPTIKRIWELIERIFIPGIQRFYTVCRPIAHIYANKYHVNVSVIRNVPFRQPPMAIKKFDQPALIYQGALNMGRGIELMIETMKYLPGFILIICGTGDLENELKQIVTDQKLENVVFKGHLAFADLASVTRRAHIGLSWEENLGKNYYYALPNKLFDYIQAQVPVMVSDLPAMAEIVTNYKVGEVIQSRQPEKLAQQIQNIYDKHHTFEPALARAAEVLCWENEEKTLIDLYKI
ncbi:MAG: glycosyltransferase [Salinivirgaceae bacterium]|jgi:glycosyltransferase involved in cell wall biosynthesis|nr:glycosyltransferase [Salinivirgaceae bacterium]